MQQDDYTDNSGRFLPETMQLQQYQVAEQRQVNVSPMHGGMQQSPINVYPTSNFGSGDNYLSTQPPPYPAPHAAPPSMTSPYPQAQLTASSGSSPLPQNLYQNPQTMAYQNQQCYAMSIEKNQAMQNMYNRPTPLTSPVSPQNRMYLHSNVPARSNSPRKSIAGMMSPILPQKPPLTTMLPQASPIIGSGQMHAPSSPLSVYAAHSLQRQTQMAQGTPGLQRGLYSAVQPQLSPRNLKENPHFLGAVQYPLPNNPQHSPITHGFHGQPHPAPISPQFSSPGPHGQLSPRLHGPHAHNSSQPAHMVIAEGTGASLRAARQLDMSSSPQKSRPYGGGLPIPTQQGFVHPMRSASHELWEDSSIQPTVTSLPVLSSDTLDLLSTLTVSTVSSPVRSSAVSLTSSEPHIQRSPLLQQHLLMPKPPIKPQPAQSINSPVLTAPSAAPATSASPMTEKQPKLHGTPKLCTNEVEEPPSRSNLAHGVRQSPILNIEEEKPDAEKTNLSSDPCAFSNLSSIVNSKVPETKLDSSIETDAPSEVSSDCKGSSGWSYIRTSPTENLSAMADDQTSSLNEPPAPAARNICTSADTMAVSVSVMTTTLSSMVPTTVTPVTSSSSTALAQCPGPPTFEVLDKRGRICEAHKAKLKEKLDLYNECLTELFFLQNGGNCMDFIQFKKRPSSKLLDYLKKMAPEVLSSKKKLRKVSRESIGNGAPASPASDISTGSRSSRKISSDDGKKGKLKSALPEEDKNDERQQMPKHAAALERSLVRNRSHSHDKAPHRMTLAKSTLSPQVSQNHLQVSKGPMSPLRLKRLSRHTTSTTLDESIGSQEEILERAKQEAVIQRKVVELRKQGLWTQRRLPKVQEPPRNKTHWDYLLEEMRWLSADFAQERKWKRAAARKLVRTVSAYHKEQHDKVKRAEREEQNRLRRISATMAREIRIFWGNIEKVVEYKQRSLLDEKRQKALDLHLSYIVDQTEKYSDWLTQGLNKQPSSAGASPTRSLTSSKPGSDDDFLPQGESSDDEETIAVAEEELEKSENNEDEISMLKQESQLPFDELLSSLPPEIIENIGKPLVETENDVADEKGEAPQDEMKSESSSRPEEKHSEEEAEDSGDESGGSKPTPISLRRSARKRKVEGADPKSEEADSAKKKKMESGSSEGDEEFCADQVGSEEDDEATVEEEEKARDVDHEKEIKDLQAEGEMPIEELMKMYKGAFDEASPQDEADSEEEESQDDGAEEDDGGEEEDSESEESENEGDSKEPEEEIGMDYLLKADVTKDDNMPMIVPVNEEDKQEKPATEGGASPNKEITDVAAEAASLQPTGFTLATTQVVTPIPVLLKHTLREYQHIGLDWLVTMYDKRLNGILADEMGLGKTIQTIALLAHLACEKGVWGPHLIVVPTSVMLNWEMEFKKWCPGFKILTYYGSQKERKAKRTGWTKSNAFHVCITSYKLVLQDNVSFRRKKWKYLVLDEAQNIKNFKSQRWQTLLNFNSQRRLLLTGTPLQNNLMELWSLMHFLMPHVFQSHKEFKEWFSNPLTGMIEGSQEYNEKLVRRLHKVLRPFLLRRIKKDVEKQMPNKYEHVVRCHLSKRQRFLYEDFMSRAATKDTLMSGHFMSVINILMQLRKVCNHPNLFEPRSIVSPFTSDQIDFHTASLITKVFEKDPFDTLNLQDYHLHLPALCNIHQCHSQRMKRLQTPRKLIEEMGVDPPAPPVRPQVTRSQAVREQLNQLLKEREKQQTKNATLSLQMPRTTSQQVNSLPVLTLPITSNSGNTLQLTTSAGTTIFPSRVITIPQPKNETGGDAVGGVQSARGAASSQSFTLQYLTDQGTRVTIPNKQIRQLPGRMVQIVTSGIPQRTSGPATTTASNPSGTTVSSRNGPANRESPGLPKEEQTKSNETVVVEPVVTEDMDLGMLTAEAYVEAVEQRRTSERRKRLERMARANKMRCEEESNWLPQDTINCLKNIYRHPSQILRKTSSVCVESEAMKELIKSPQALLKKMQDITDRFVFIIPKVESAPVDFHVSHPSPSEHAVRESVLEKLKPMLNNSMVPFHRIQQATRIQFPEVRLIQYDCGKLQVLDVLLRRFWTEKHRCLIFTQMTKVLDILEAFLSYHGYRYLRLDGSTRVEQRMSLMERFNNDPRIFCFILSTRSGGVGVNLTGADTVIFYDSDWNPTMDAQAQDRCHRIGQTRDVHIYRLISERTVEENILKKANQKRLLGDLAIEGGSFTTAFFKEQAIKDLFNEPTGLEDLPSTDSIEEKKAPEQTVAVLSKPITARQKAIAAAKEAEVKSMDTSDKDAEVAVGTAEAKPDAAVVSDTTSQDPTKGKEVRPSNWEYALQETEDKEDVDAAKLAKEEQDADMEEFTENADGEDGEGQVSRVQEELKSLYDELTPIEQYALRYLEETTEEVNKEELELAEEQVHQSKKDWEITHLMALKEEEERRLEEEEDEIFYTREDAENQVNEGKKGGKRKRKKERDICFLDMSSSSSEDENAGIDVETLNEDEDYEDIRFQNEPGISPIKNNARNAKRSKKTKTAAKKPGRPRNAVRGRGASQSGTARGGLARRPNSGVGRDSSMEMLSPSKRRRASELAYDITTHGYYQNDDYYYYNDDDEDSLCGQEPPWEEDDLQERHLNPYSPYNETPWCDEDDWPSSPSGDEYYGESADDSEHDDRTVCIVTDESPNKLAANSGRPRLWSEKEVPSLAGQKSANANKTPLYNIVVETNATPGKSPLKAAKSRIDVSTIRQQVSRTINFNSPATKAVRAAVNFVPTISLKPQAPVQPIQPTKSPMVQKQPAPAIQLVTALPVKPQQPQVLNKILQQQAVQRQKLQSYKIPLIKHRTAGQTQGQRNVLPRTAQTIAPNQTFHFAPVQGSRAATVIPLSQISAINLTPAIRTTLAQQPPSRVFTLANAPGKNVRRKTPSVMVPISSLGSQQQTFFIQHSTSGQPIHIITNSTAVNQQSSAGSRAAATTGNILRASTGSNLQKNASAKAKRKPAPKQSPVTLPGLVRKPPKSSKVVTQTKKKIEVDRGIFDIVNSMEFMSPPLPDPSTTDGSFSSKTSVERSLQQGSLFDSLEQEFLKEGGCDLTIGSGDEDDMITLDLEPVSPSDPQLFDPTDQYDNEEERNVFESFQSLLQQ